MAPTAPPMIMTTHRVEKSERVSVHAQATEDNMTEARSKKPTKPRKKEAFNWLARSIRCDATRENYRYGTRRTRVSSSAAPVTHSNVARQNHAHAE
ncbi:unnamed protein product, partial [Mesorhabditis belari]|uniref:Uncharacterized protein n=1 Tax=Mesorhabditis belari TaxID=2138241 RepID=A0AAF3E7Z4_9BILA